MFSFFYGLFWYLFKREEYHVLMLGADNGGKTTLLEHLKGKYSREESLPPEKILPTVGLNIGRIEAFKTKLIIWDLGGAAGLRSIWENYYEEAHAVVFVVDAADDDADRWADARGAIDVVLASERLDGAPLLVLANKRDKEGAVGEEETWSRLGMRGRPNERQVRIQSISALEGDGVDDAFCWLVETAKQSPRSAALRASGVGVQ